MGAMKFRSHVGRGIDLRLRSNQAIVALTLIAGAIGLGLAVFGDASAWFPISTGGVTFLTWALTRELDPDRDSTALLAAFMAGIWAIAGMPVALFPLAALLLAARLIVESTGRRPLPGDLIFVAVLATAASHTRVGWITGFGLALAIYVDDRMASEHNRNAVYAAIGAAVGATVVASLFGAFPEALPAVDPAIAIAFAGLALVAVLREPPTPTSFCDSKRMTFLDAHRLQASRVLVTLVMVVAAMIGGADAPVLIPAAVAMALSLASSELARAQRATK